MPWWSSRPKSQKTRLKVRDGCNDIVLFLKYHLLCLSAYQSTPFTHQSHPPHSYSLRLSVPLLHSPNQRPRHCPRHRLLSSHHRRPYTSPGLFKRSLPQPMVSLHPRRVSNMPDRATFGLTHSHPRASYMIGPAKDGGKKEPPTPIRHSSRKPPTRAEKEFIDMG